MKKTRWFIASLLAAALVFGSCSSDSDDDDDSSASSTTSSSSSSADLSAFSTPSLSELAGKTFYYTEESSEKRREYYFTFSASGVTCERYTYYNESAVYKKSSHEYVCTYADGVLTYGEADDDEKESVLLRKYDGTLYLIYSDFALSRTSGSGLYATFSREWIQNEGLLDEVSSSYSVTLNSDNTITSKETGSSTGGDMTYTDTGTGTFTVKDNLIISAAMHFVYTMTTVSSRFGTETETDEYDEDVTMVYDGTNLLFADVLKEATSLPTVTE